MLERMYIIIIVTQDYPGVSCNMHDGSVLQWSCR